MVQYPNGPDSESSLPSHVEPFMPLPNNLARYMQHVQALDMALANPIDGLRVQLKNHGQAVRFRQMCYKARQLYQAQTGDFSKWATLIITFADEAKTALHIAPLGIDDVQIIPLDGNYDYEPTPIPELEDTTRAVTPPVDKRALADQMLAEENRRQRTIYPNHNTLAVDTPMPRPGKYMKPSKEDADREIDPSITNYDESKAPGTIAPNVKLDFE